MWGGGLLSGAEGGLAAAVFGVTDGVANVVPIDFCLLYTSDDADERSSVDLGGSRIIKKKNSRERSTERVE